MGDIERWCPQCGRSLTGVWGACPTPGCLTFPAEAAEDEIASLRQQLEGAVGREALWGELESVIASLGERDYQAAKRIVLGDSNAGGR